MSFQNWLSDVFPDFVALTTPLIFKFCGDNESAKFWLINVNDNAKFRLSSLQKLLSQDCAWNFARIFPSELSLPQSRSSIPLFIPPYIPPSFSHLSINPLIPSSNNVRWSKNDHKIAVEQLKFSTANIFRTKYDRELHFLLNAPCM